MHARLCMSARTWIYVGRTSASHYLYKALILSGYRNETHGSAFHSFKDLHPHAKSITQAY